MLTNLATGIASIRHTQAGSSSRSPRSTPLADRIRPYTLSQRLPLPNRYDAPTSSGAGDGRGGTTGPTQLGRAGCGSSETWHGPYGEALRYPETWLCLWERRNEHAVGEWKW